MHNKQVEPISVLTVGRAEAIQLWFPAGEDPLAAGQSADLQLIDRQGNKVYSLSGWQQAGEGRWNAVLPKEIELWSIVNPVLYRLSGKIGTREVDQWVGFRWWSSYENRYVELNGKPIYLRGVIRGISAHDHPNLTGLPDEQWHEKSIREIKKFGMNLVRWHSTVPPESYLDVADRLGFAVHIEIGFEKKDGQIIVNREFWQKVLRVVCRHPSVAVYCIGNEIRQCGTVPQVQELAEIAREFDSSVLVMDNCGWGQPDRPNPDVYCQHVAYFFPYGKHERMFDYPIGFDLEGLCDEKSGYNSRNPRRPVLAHEVCHYIAMRDFATLERKWREWKEKVKPAADHDAAELPWWIAETQNLYKQKGLDKYEPALRHASRVYQQLCQRHAIESIRRSPALSGFEMLQHSDCWKYENSNGLLDSFDDPIHTDPEGFAKFNGDTVLLIDLPRRDFCFGQQLEIPVWVSHYGDTALIDSVLTVQVKVGDRLMAETRSKIGDKIEPGSTVLLQKAALVLRRAASPMQASLEIQLQSGDHKYSQTWPLWLFPPVSERELEHPGLIRKLDEQAFKRLENGESLFWEYRPEDIFDPNAPRLEYDFEGRKNLFKGVIWDRGDHLGAVVRSHSALGQLPHEGVLDWQLAPLAHEACKINLDDFPVPVEPIIQGVGRPCRDRMQVMKFGMKEIQPKTTFRRWGWLFELAVGKGKLLVSGFNFAESPAAGNYLKKAILDDLAKPASESAAKIEPSVLRDYLAKKAKEPRPVEGPMTIYWLADKDPVETKLFWEELGIKLR